MNVLFVSQCTKRALTETRRILDQFAERRGDRTWQTPITQAGLAALRKLLRKTARKNTAVACHWIRGKDHSELLWIVGDAGSFNMRGATPTNTTVHDLLRAEDENSWHHLQMMRAVTALAALLHDLGKATKAFQDRLALAVCASSENEGGLGRNHYRHEWVSVRLFQAFVGAHTDNDTDWLQRLGDGVLIEDLSVWETYWQGKDRLMRDGIDDLGLSSAELRQKNPFNTLPPLAQAVAWLILTHHRLPALPVENKEKSTRGVERPREERRYKSFGSKPGFLNSSTLDVLLSEVNADWNAPRDTIDMDSVQTYWQFPHGLPVAHIEWRKKAAREAKKLLRYTSCTSNHIMSDPFQIHVSRLGLMLADHYYSRLNSFYSTQQAKWIPVDARQRYVQADSALFANTVRHHGVMQYNHGLVEHLLGVQAQSSLIIHALPGLVRSLPHLKHHKVLKQRSKSPHFRWQDKAADMALSLQKRSEEHGAFIVNMASTGCGKTLGNARIMNALSHPSRGMRCAFAMGLRTLTLQTGRSFQNDVGLDDEALAIQVGGQSSKDLFEYYEQQAEQTGSESWQALLDETGQVLYEGDDQHPLLARLSDDKKVRDMLAAPVLVCTVDHLTPATESLRGGRQIAPMLRLMSGDLVLDEPDDFDLEDLRALTRLVHWAGLLGSRILLSSATLPPALINGLYEAYRDGRRHFQRNRGQRPDEEPEICCMWVDEFHQAQAACTDKAMFKKHHAEFVEKRSKNLASEKVRRVAELVSIAELGQVAGEHAQKSRRQLFARIVRDAAWRLHQMPQNHTVDTTSGKRVSFGLVRMANIGPLYDVALSMYQLGAPPGVRIHLCVYHSQYPLFIRSHIEHRLDTCLNRRDMNAVLQRPDVRHRIDAYTEKDHLFIVLGSPVTEVGRDHDYDWAVVEPSSVRSIIQLAGRVRRHRQEAVDQVNMLILDHNLRHFDSPSGKGIAAFCKPGFEVNERKGEDKKSFYGHLNSHDVHELIAPMLDKKGQWRIDARPRISGGNDIHTVYGKLTYLEHYRMKQQMQVIKPDEKTGQTGRINASSHWAEKCTWVSGVLPQFQRFRDDDRPQEEVVFLPDDDEEELLLYQIHNQGKGKNLYAKVDDSKLNKIDNLVVQGNGIVPWGGEDPLELLKELAEEMDKPLSFCAKAYATTRLPKSEDGWRFHSALGFNLEQ